MNPEISSTDRFVDRIARTKALDPIADAIQPLARKTLDGTGIFAPLKDLLHGKPLGHSAHVVMTDVPIGAWTMAAIFDTLELVGRTEFLCGGRCVGSRRPRRAGSARSRRGSPSGPIRRTNPSVWASCMRFRTTSRSHYTRFRSGCAAAGGAPRSARGQPLPATRVMSFGAYLGGELSIGTADRHPAYRCAHRSAGRFRCRAR